MRLDQAAEVHAEDLIAAQQKHIADPLIVDEENVLPDGVGGAAVPLGRLVGLLGGKDLDETTAKGVEIVGVGDVPVQTHAEKLRQHVDTADIAVDAVADGDVNQTILAGQGDSRFTAQFRQGIQPCAPTAAQDQGENIVHDRLPSEGLSPRAIRCLMFRTVCRPDERETRPTGDMREFSTLANPAQPPPLPSAGDPASPIFQR